MKMNSKRGAWVLALFMAFGTGAATVKAVAAPFFQDQDYSKYKTYQQGVRDGKADQAAKKDHSRKRNYKKDEDRKAYEAGYQKARGN